MIKTIYSQMLTKNGVIHGFTERTGGVSPAPTDSLNTKVSPLAPDELQNVSRNLGEIISGSGEINDKFTLLYLEGKSTVVQVQNVDGLQTLYNADGAVTQQKGAALAITVADCLPILLIDKDAGVIGISHAGWKGSVDQITTKVVNQMVSLGANAENIMAALGPGICADCYEVGPEVAERFEREFTKKRDNGKYSLDLAGVNITELKTAGITQIDNLDICTYENTDRFFSARKEKKTGRFLAYIKLPLA